MAFTHYTQHNLLGNALCHMYARDRRSERMFLRAIINNRVLEKISQQKVNQMLKPNK